MGKRFCVESHANYLTHILKDLILYNIEILRVLRFKSSYAFLNRCQCGMKLFILFVGCWDWSPITFVQKYAYITYGNMYIGNNYGSHSVNLPYTYVPIFRQHVPAAQQPLHITHDTCFLGHPVEEKKAPHSRAAIYILSESNFMEETETVYQNPILKLFFAEYCCSVLPVYDNNPRNK